MATDREKEKVTKNTERRTTMGNNITGIKTVK
jgi:hypothetical protein